MTEAFVILSSGTRPFDSSESSVGVSIHIGSPLEANLYLDFLIQ